MSVEIIIYTTRFCPFCVRAKQLLDAKKVEYIEIAVDSDAALRKEMTAKAGSRSVPQIWISGDHIGGCDDLFALDRSGGLDSKLAR